MIIQMELEVFDRTEKLKNGFELKMACAKT